jgi:hypothetical protein
MNSFLEITSNDNWFKQHPEKIAGEEYETTSFYFPIMVRGKKEDVLRVTGMSEVAQKNELFKTAVSIAESRVKSAQSLLNEAKTAAARTKAMRDLQTEQSSLAEAKAYLKKLEQVTDPDKEKKLRLMKAKAKAIKVKLSLGQLGVSSIKKQLKLLTLQQKIALSESLEKQKSPMTPAEKSMMYELREEFAEPITNGDAKGFKRFNNYVKMIDMDTFGDRWNNTWIKIYENTKGEYFTSTYIGKRVYI